MISLRLFVRYGLTVNTSIISVPSSESYMDGSILVTHLVNRIGAIRYFGRCADIFSLVNHSVNFLQKKIIKRNICTIFVDGKLIEDKSLWEMC